jgi:lysophospholipase L1-like esterase
VTPSPTVGAERERIFGNEIRTKVKTVNHALSQLSDGKKVIFVDFGDKSLEPDGSLSRKIMQDFFHPSPKGYQI